MQNPWARLITYISNKFHKSPFCRCEAYELENSCYPKSYQGFPGGLVVKDLLANVGDVSSTNGLERSHLPQIRVPKPMCHRYWACALEPRSYNYRPHTPQQLKPVCPRARVPHQEKPSKWEARAPQLESSPHLPQLEKSPHSNKDPALPKIINKEFFLIEWLNEDTNENKNSLWT